MTGHAGIGTVMDGRGEAPVTSYAIAFAMFEELPLSPERAYASRASGTSTVGSSGMRSSLAGSAEAAK